MNSDEKASVAEQFGVAAEQVERDHLISHLLAFLARDFGDSIHFIGGTALARTHLPHGRLSEDIDKPASRSRRGTPYAPYGTPGHRSADPPERWITDESQI